MDRSRSGAGEPAPLDARHTFSIVLAFSTLLLIFAGGLVTTTGSGLAVPDWPLSFGTLWPRMRGGVLFEHGHRMLAAGVGFMTLVLTVWTVLREKRRAVRWLAIWALLAVSTQGVLGGMTVRYKLPWQVSTLHGTLAQLFFCTTIALAVVTSPWWPNAPALRQRRGLVPTRVLALATTAAALVQLLLGASMRHLGAGLIIPDFPLSYGKLLPPFWTPEVAIHFAHRVWAFVVAALVVATAYRVLRTARDCTPARRLAIALPAVITLQIVLGIIVILKHRPVTPTTLHVAGGATVLGLSFWLTLVLFRITWRGAEDSPGGTPQSDTTTRPTAPRAPAPAQPLAVGGSATAYASRASDLLALTKPGIGFLVVLTALAGYWIAAPAGAVELDTLLALLAGTALVGAGANAGNMLLERRHDARMRRTANRPLPAGRLRPITAAGFMAVLTLGGLALLWAGTGPLPTALGGLAWLLYLAAYTPMKRRTSLNTLVGAIPGALPPLMGWAAARDGIDPMGLVLFAILFLWQIPHFFAIAELYADDYRQAGYAMLPVTQAGASSAARLGALYCSALLPVTLLPVALGHAGRLYLLCAVTLGLAFLLAGLAHAIGRSRPRARRLFLLSLLYLPSLLATLAIDRI